MMKTLFNTRYSNRSLDFVLFILRVAIAAFMLTHGLPKLHTLLAGGEIKFADPMGIGALPTMILVVFAEVLCSVLVALGLMMRFALIPLIINVLVAVFVIHAADGFGKQELGAHYLLIYVVLLFLGSGKYSADHLISRKKSRARRRY